MLRAEKIDKYFNRFRKNKIHVINHTSIDFGEKGLVALLGPSGSGKTTLLNVIGGLDKVRRGKIYVNGKRITGRSQHYIDKVRNLNIGYIFQDYKLVEDLSVYDNVSLVLKMIGIKDKKEIDKRVCYVLDKVGMLRYKKRPCNMLSGGERQRVGIARAIVKNPSIIIADEPTGNLDSRNSVEIMNIIKAISKDKLVVLVTHEVNLAKFYASRIVELEDGKIINDYLNENEADLDYEIGNVLYLKDYEYKKNINENSTIYSNHEENLKLDIVISNHNIYIRSNDYRKIEVVDSESSVEMIDDHYKNISRDDALKYEFNFEEIINKNKKIRYSSIFNPITFITNGFKKVFGYSIIKKLLLGGFFLSGIFIMFATSNIVASLNIKDENFVEINRNYLLIEINKTKVDDYLKLEKNLDINYMIPGNSMVKGIILVDDIYQFTEFGATMEGSLASINLVDEENLVAGRLPENNYEIVIDKTLIKKMNKDSTEAKMIGLNKAKDYLDKDLKISRMNNFKIVGVVDTNSPSIYVDDSMFIDILYYSKNSDDTFIVQDEAQLESLEFEDYELNRNKLVLKQGRWPVNDYEVLINYNLKDDFKLNKNVNKKINDIKLKVVGYYTSKDPTDSYFVNKNMIKYLTIKSLNDITIYPKDKDTTLSEVHNNYNYNIKDSYQSSREKYIKEQKDTIKASVISSGIILLISLIEIILMIRSSFLSRVKEVGIYRAIGVKKKDIYVMFSGEIIAITTIASLPGILLCAYILKLVSGISFFENFIMINPFIVILSIASIYVFNVVIGLIPVFNTLRKRPAEILARTDI